MSLHLLTQKMVAELMTDGHSRSVSAFTLRWGPVYVSLLDRRSVQSVYQPLTQWPPMTPMSYRQQLTGWIDEWRFFKELIHFPVASLVLYKFCILEVTEALNLMRAEAI